MIIKTKYNLDQIVIMEGNSVYKSGIPVVIKEVITSYKKNRLRISYRVEVKKGGLKGFEFIRVEKKLYRMPKVFKYIEIK